MYFLNVFDSEALHLIAETSIIVIGSILMGILLAYLHWSGYKKRMHELDEIIKTERDQAAELNNQITYLHQLRDQLTHDIAEEKSRYGLQSKQLYEKTQQLYHYENEAAKNQLLIGQLTTALESHEKKIEIINKEMARSVTDDQPLSSYLRLQPLRANYDRVSELLGKTVTENDLTLMAGIGTRTSSLLQAHGIDTWEKLSQTPVEMLQSILSKAGGVYKTQDPTYWPKQALMASQSEWRKLRVFQESLKNPSGS